MKESLCSFERWVSLAMPEPLALYSPSGVFSLNAAIAMLHDLCARIYSHLAVTGPGPNCRMAFFGKVLSIVDPKERSWHLQASRISAKLAVEARCLFGVFFFLLRF